MPDHNRPPQARIDLFCYLPTGEVVRQHPGRSPQGAMQPHSMPPTCNMFDVALARSVGVGAALHLRPPRLVATSSATQPGASSSATQPGHVLCTRQDMSAFCTYDIKSVNWRQVRDKLVELGDEDLYIEWSEGDHFPWWIWLSNIGNIRDVANHGISRVRLIVTNGTKCVVVDSVRGTYNISMDPVHGNMIVRPPPRLYRSSQWPSKCCPIVCTGCGSACRCFSDLHKLLSRCFSALRRLLIFTGQ